MKQPKIRGIDWRPSALSGECRRGMTLTECVVALGVLSIAMVAVVQLLGTMASQRRAAEQRRVALQELANQAESLAAAPWEELDPATLTRWQASPELAAALPTASCRIEIKEIDEELLTRQVRLQVDWKNSSGQTVKPVELTIWRYQPQEEP